MIYSHTSNTFHNPLAEIPKRMNLDAFAAMQSWDSLQRRKHCTTCSDRPLGYFQYFILCHDYLRPAWGWYLGPNFKITKSHIRLSWNSLCILLTQRGESWSLFCLPTYCRSKAMTKAKMKETPAKIHGIWASPVMIPSTGQSRSISFLTELPEEMSALVLQICWRNIHIFLVFLPALWMFIDYIYISCLDRITL